MSHWPLRACVRWQQGSRGYRISGFGDAGSVPARLRHRVRPVALAPSAPKKERECVGERFLFTAEPKLSGVKVDGPDVAISDDTVEDVFLPHT